MLRRTFLLTCAYIAAFPDWVLGQTRSAQWYECEAEVVTKRHLNGTTWRAFRCPMDRYTTVIEATGGWWEEIRVDPDATYRNGKYLVKVTARASAYSIVNLDSDFVAVSETVARNAMTLNRRSLRWNGTAVELTGQTYPVRQADFDDVNGRVSNVGSRELLGGAL